MTASQRVALVDLGLGNLRSVERALDEAAALIGTTVTTTITRDPARVAAADLVVVPGQGAFRDGSAALDGALGDALRDAIARDKRYFGICLGLQLLFETSDEAPGARGLGVLDGTNARLSNAGGVKVPHMGWNQLELSPVAGAQLQAATAVSPWFYFVHSFHAVPADPSVVAARVTHGANVVTAAVHRKNVLAVQFHPEKSQKAGIVLLAEILRG